MGQISSSGIASSLGPGAFGTPTVAVGLAPAAPGVANTALRSDAKLVIDLTISPTWTGNHTFSPAVGNTNFSAGAVRITNNNEELQIGAAQQFRQFFDGANSVIRSDAGELRINIAGTDVVRVMTGGIRADGGAGGTTTLNVVGVAGAAARSLINSVHLGVSNGFSVDSDGAGLMIYKFSNAGTTASAANAFMDSANANNLLRSTSSARYKTNVREFSDTKIIDALQPITYQSLCAADDPEREHFGLIAEEVAKISSSLVSFDTDGRAESVQYERLVVPLIAYVKRLQRRIARLERKSWLKLFFG